MTTVSVTLPSDGSAATVSQYNNPITTIVNTINGNLDDTNIASLSGTKITAGTIPGSALTAAAAGGWNVLNQTFTYTANNGNKEFTGTFPADLTSTLSAGMKLQLTRGTTAPTQAMAFTAASSQYATKASPSGISFTSAFTCEAWVYLNSYPSGDTGIISRFDGSNGFIFILKATGQIQQGYYAATNGTSQVSSQSLPLKQWVHIAASVSSVSGKTIAMYINGTLVPSTLLTSAATTMVQGGSLQLAAFNSTGFFDGYISEARIWSAAQSQANIQANMRISPTGSESGLVALFQGNGNFNDKTSNANNLTASGGAIATQAANPYNNIEYAIVTKVGAFSGGVTPVTIFTGTDYGIPNMTLTNAQYSTARAPFGFPAARGRWIVQQIQKTYQAQLSATVNVWYNIGLSQISVPTGDWSATWSASIGGTGASVNTATIATLSSTNNGETNPELTAETDVNPAGQVAISVGKTGSITTTTQSIYYLNTRALVRNGDTLFNINGDAAQVITAECAYI